MIVNFEDYTYELTPREIDVVIPALKKIFLKSGGRYIKSYQLCKELEQIGIKISDADLRRCITGIQLEKKMLWIVATQNGFAYTQNVEDAVKQIQGLRSRENAIRAKRMAFESTLPTSSV